MSLERQVKALARLPIFAAFEPEALRLIAFAGETVQFGAGEIIFRSGDESDGGFLILAGSVMLDLGHGSMDDNKIAGPGALVGEVALFTATVQPATAIARENSTVLKIRRNLIQRVLQEFPESARQAIAALSRQIEGFGKDLEKARQAF